MTASAVSPGHVTKFPALIAAIHVACVGKPAAACRNLTAADVDGKEWTFCALSSVRVDDFLFSLLTPTSHNPVFALHPWISAGAVGVRVRVPSLWMVPPQSRGWKTVVYPSSANFPALINDCWSRGRTSTSLALLGSVWNGSVAFTDPLMVLPSGRKTCLVDGVPVWMISMDSVAKCDVAPESIIIVSF